MNKIYENIKAIRQTKGLTQTYLAEKIGIAINNYGKLERGEIQLTIERLEQLAGIFGMSVVEIIEYGTITKTKQEDNLAKLLGFNLERIIVDVRSTKSRIEILTRWVLGNREVYEKLNETYLAYQQTKYEKDVEMFLAEGIKKEDVLAMEVFQKDSKLYKANYERSLEQFLNLLIMDFTLRFSKQLPYDGYKIDFEKLLQTDDFSSL
jgi:transcriptional regulator with XRE-family HTH domain